MRKHPFASPQTFMAATRTAIKPSAGQLACPVVPGEIFRRDVSTAASPQVSALGSATSSEPPPAFFGDVENRRRIGTAREATEIAGYGRQLPSQVVFVITSVPGRPEKSLRQHALAEGVAEILHAIGPTSIPYSESVPASYCPTSVWFASKPVPPTMSSCSFGTHPPPEIPAVHPVGRSEAADFYGISLSPSTVARLVTTYRSSPSRR